MYNLDMKSLLRVEFEGGHMKIEGDRDVVFVGRENGGWVFEPILVLRDRVEEVLDSGSRIGVGSLDVPDPEGLNESD